jgi:hypothetical protein
MNNVLDFFSHTMFYSYSELFLRGWRFDIPFVSFTHTDFFLRFHKDLPEETIAHITHFVDITEPDLIESSRTLMIENEKIKLAVHLSVIFARKMCLKIFLCTFFIMLPFSYYILVIIYNSDTNNDTDHDTNFFLYRSNNDTNQSS